MSLTAQAILAAAAVVTALGVLWRASKLGELLRGTRLFLLDWLGEPARPGVAGRRSFPERMADVETRTHDTERRTADLQHTFRGEVTSRLELLAQGQERLESSAVGNGQGIERLDGRLSSLERRQSEHRRRNEEQIDRLRTEVDRRLSSISGDLLRAETYRAALHELGLDLEPPARKNPLESPPFAPLEEPE